MPRTVLEVLSDYSSDVEITVEIDSSRRSDGTLKTWYFSSHPGRSTGAGETPANTIFYPYLKSPLGPLSQSLTEESLFSGLANSDPGSITLLQSNPSPDYLSSFHDYTFAGYEVRIKIGGPTDLYADFALYRTVSVGDKEPNVILTSEGIKATLSLSSALSTTLRENLQVNRYFGSPHCVKNLSVDGYISRAHNSIYDLTSFTLMGKFRIPATGIVGSAQADLARKFNSASDANWQVNIGHASGTFPHKLRARLTVGGTLVTIGPSTTSYNDDLWHTWVYAALGGSTSYLMIDGKVLGIAALSGNPNTQTITLYMGGGVVGNHMNGGSQMDLRIYNHYKSPKDARIAAGSKAQSSDSGLIALWLADDNTGPTVNDYSSSNLDATISGTVNVDYKWDASDLGDSELAGQQMVSFVGEVFNLQVQYADADRERVRFNDRASYEITNSLATVTLRSRGTLLSGGGVDYTLPSGASDSVIPLTSPEDEPLTLTLTSNGTDDTDFYPSSLVERLMLLRSDIYSSLSLSDALSLTIQTPWKSGYRLKENDTLSAALEKIWGESGVSYYEDREGLLVPNLLTPPLGYGPYNEPVIVLDRRADSGIQWADTVPFPYDIVGSCTICCWFKTTISDQTTADIGGAEPNFGSLFLVHKGSNYRLYFQSVGSNAGRLSFYLTGMTNPVYSSVGLVKGNQWYFAAGVFDNAANTVKIYLGDLVSTPNYVSINGAVYIAQVGSASYTSTPTANSEPLSVGGASDSYYNAHTVQHAAVWREVKTSDQLAELMITHPVGNESNLITYVPGNEGAGDPLEVVSNSLGAYTANGFPVETIWAPRFTVDLSTTPSVTLTDFRHLTPASEIIVKYKENQDPLSDGDFDTGVSQQVKAELKSPYLESITNDDDLKDQFKRAKKVVFDSPFTDKTSAQKLLDLLVDRLGENIYVGVIKFPNGLNISRLALSLLLMEEIGIKTPIPYQLVDGRCFKVVAIQPNLTDLSTVVVFWG